MDVRIFVRICRVEILSMMGTASDRDTYFALCMIHELAIRVRATYRAKLAKTLSVLPKGEQNLIQAWVHVLNPGIALSASTKSDLKTNNSTNRCGLNWDWISFKLADVLQVLPSLSPKRLLYWLAFGTMYKSGQVYLVEGVFGLGGITRIVFATKLFRETKRLHAIGCLSLR